MAIKKNEQGFVQIILILIVIAAVVGIYYFGVSKKNQNEVLGPIGKYIIESNTQTQNSTTDWKTYTNETMKYTFNYPSKWRVEDIGADIGVNKALINENGISVLYFLSTENNDHLSLENSYKTKSCFETTCQPLLQANIIAVKEVLKINGQNALVVNADSKKYYFFDSSDTITMLQMLTNDSTNLETFNQILSTFKFLDAKESPKTQSYVVPSTWIKITTKDGLKLCLPPKWESKNEYGELVYDRDSSYMPTITIIQNIPYSGGSMAQAYYDFWKSEYSDASQLLTESDVDINGNKTKLFTPKGDVKSSPEGITLAWYASGKLWKAGLSNWNMINSSKSDFLSDFYKMISCGF